MNFQCNFMNEISGTRLKDHFMYLCAKALSQGIKIPRMKTLAHQVSLFAQWRIFSKTNILTSFSEHVCRYCGQNFDRRKLLELHINLNHKYKDENGIVRYKSHLCVETFSRAFTLKNHLIDFHGGKIAVFSCPLCPDILFQSYNLLQEHIFSEHLLASNEEYGIFKLVKSGLKHAIDMYSANIAELDIQSFEQLRQTNAIMEPLIKLLRNIAIDKTYCKVSFVITARFVKKNESSKFLSRFFDSKNEFCRFDYFISYSFISIHTD